MKRALVIGLGVSGKAACKLLLKQGYEVVGADARSEIVEGVQSISDKERLSPFCFDLVVPSPGIPKKHPYYQMASASGIPICGEAQLALSTLSQTMVGITGTNGKTTVTMLVAHALRTSGRKAKTLGNIGEALALYALDPDPEEILVVELSSYQLETMRGEFFDAGAILNITPDHLDRYATMRVYAMAKWRMQHCLRKKRPLFIDQTVMDKFGDLSETDQVMCYLRNEENIEVSWLLSQTLGVTQEEFRCALGTFKKPPHRIEYLGAIHGVRYYDDSKGTNVDAVIRAVETMDGPVWLIAGGVDKGASYSPWKTKFASKVKKIFAMGQAKTKISKEAGMFCPVKEVDSLEDAVNMAADEAVVGGNVLLSPGCSSFDMFDDYAHRGREFQRCVTKLRERS